MQRNEINKRKETCKIPPQQKQTSDINIQQIESENSPRNAFSHEKQITARVEKTSPF
jgi:hypothetical protein